MKSFIEARKRDLFYLFTGQTNELALRALGFTFEEKKERIDVLAYHLIVKVTKNEKCLILKGFISHRFNGGDIPSEIEVVENNFLETELEAPLKLCASL